MPDHFSKTSEALLEAVANAAVELLRLHDVNGSIPRILEMLGTATDVDRMQLMQIEGTDTGATRVVRHQEWCAPGIRPAGALLQLEGRLLEHDGFGEWTERLSRGEIVTGAPEDFAPPIRRKLLDDEIRSVMVVPVFVDDRWWGQIALDDCRSVRHWTSSEVDALRTLAELLGTAVLRARDVARLADARRIVENSPTLLFRLGAWPPFPLHYVSPNIERYGYGSRELLARPDRWQNLIDPQDLPNLMRAIEGCVSAGACRTSTEFRLVRPDGSRAWFEGHSSPCRDSASNIVAIEGIITDITERKQAASEIERLARTDTLTGLANRSVFIDRLTAACAGARRNGRRFAVHFVDLDLFKPVNDTLGHPVGDELLKAVAQRMRRAVRADDVVARYGGDEFVILQCGIPSRQIAEDTAAKLCAAINEPYVIGGNRVEISTSIGVVFNARGRTSPEEVMKRADLALYRAKGEGRNRACTYDPALDSLSDRSAADKLRAAPAA